jgi:REP element-mobilizing transposase RayT
MNDVGPPNDKVGSTAERNANREIGVPGWHHRGYLPHFDDGEAVQHVTFHLADSLPKDVFDRLETEAAAFPEKKREVERRKRIEAWMDAGHGSCVLKEPDIAAMVQETLLFFDGQRYRVFAWVVMPNHVHVLFQPIHGWTVAKIVASWKKYTARRICEHRRKSGNANLPIGGEANANQEIGVPGDQPVWHREYWDRYMRDDYHFLQAVEYIHQNPVKAGLVGRPEDWPWSSAYAGSANLLIGEGTIANREIGVPERNNQAFWT